MGSSSLIFFLIEMFILKLTRQVNLFYSLISDAIKKGTKLIWMHTTALWHLYFQDTFSEYWMPKDISLNRKHIKKLKFVSSEYGIALIS